MNALELVIWYSLTLICLQLGDKPLYEHYQDLKEKWNRFIGIDKDINQYEDLEENIEGVVNYMD